MRERTYAGIKAGLVVSVLFSLIPLALVLGIFGLVGSPTDLISSFGPTLVVAVLVLVAISGLVGCVLGLIFATLIDRLPLHSTYSKALVLGLCLWLVFLFAMPTRIIVDLFVLGGFLVESSCFAYLYSKWTKTELHA